MFVEQSADVLLRQALDSQNAKDLKDVLHLRRRVPAASGRKGDMIDAIARHMLGEGAQELWNGLSELEQAAVSEAVHGDGTLHQLAFKAKYGQPAPIEVKDKHGWQRTPKILRWFFQPSPQDRSWGVPKDLRERLARFVPKPAEARLRTLAHLPEKPTHPRSTGQQWKDGFAHEPAPRPLIERSSETAALQDLRTMLRLAEQEKLAVSAKTSRPGSAAIAALNDLLHGHDYFDLDEKDGSGAEIGPIKSFSWPLLLQAAGLAKAGTGKLALTPAGRKALVARPADTLRAIWRSWIETDILDEFSRIDHIKGQTGKGARSFSEPSSRRRAVHCALARCPVGQWAEAAEFSRYLLAAGFEFTVTTDSWSLYICDAQYGSLGYDGCNGWNILEERYLFCLLFEYAAPLGIIDIAYEHPDGARTDHAELWGASELAFLSRYDGLKYIRLTPLGAFILGQTEAYEPPNLTTRVSLSVLPNGRIQVEGGELSPDQKLLLESFAESDGAMHWRLDQARALKAIEQGASVAQLREFLRAGDSQPLPEFVEGFLEKVERQGRACVFKSRALLLECSSPEVADLIASNPRMSKLCRRTGDRDLVVRETDEKAFRDGLNSIGYGMPKV